MINLILIDTNIYRQLGLGFYNNPDYKNLVNYCYASGSEIRIPEVVYNEFISYYHHEIIDKSFKDIEQSIAKIKDIPSLNFLTNSIPDIGSFEKAKDFISEQFTNNALVLKDIFVPVGLISDFLIKNKQETKKDNTRDFLIWLTAIREAQVHIDDQVILISNDKIFRESTYFNQILIDLELSKRLFVYTSIADVLNKFGVQYDFLTSDIILENIPKTKIEREIKKELNSFPSYISGLFYHTRKKFVVEKFDIDDIQVDSFYSFKDIDTGKTKFLSHIKVFVNIVYGPEKADLIENHLKNLPDLHRELETFDDENRPIFKQEILFIFEGELNISKKSINKIRFIDFIIDYYFDIYKTAAPNMQYA